MRWSTRSLGLAAGLGLSLGSLAVAPSASAAEPPASAPPPPVAEATAPASQSRLQVSITCLALPVGQVVHDWGHEAPNDQIYLDSAFAYGVSPSVSYVLVRGLSIGLAPQFLFHVKAQQYSSSVGVNRELDWMARVAYAIPLLDKLALYIELLPGYSYLTGDGPHAQGFVLGIGAGATIDLPGNLYANLGVGYQDGSQESGGGYDFSTRFTRIALGVGMKL